MRLFPKMWKQIQVAAGVDNVVLHWAIPGESTINGLWLDLRLIGSEISELNAAMYGADAFVLPVLDPDAAQAVNDMWDKQVATTRSPATSQSSCLKRSLGSRERIPKGRQTPRLQGLRYPQ